MPHTCSIARHVATVKITLETEHPQAMMVRWVDELDLLDPVLLRRLQITGVEVETIAPTTTEED